MHLNKIEWPTEPLLEEGADNVPQLSPRGRTHREQDGEIGPRAHQYPSHQRPPAANLQDQGQTPEGNLKVGAGEGGESDNGVEDAASSGDTPTQTPRDEPGESDNE